MDSSRHESFISNTFEAVLNLSFLIPMRKHQMNYFEAGNDEIFQCEVTMTIDYYKKNRPDIPERFLHSV
jgi:hypothetical protein